MDLLLLLFGVFGTLVVTFGHRISLLARNKNVRWHTKILYVLLSLIIGVAVFAGLYAIVYAIFFLASSLDAPWPEWVYIALAVILPVFNIIMWVWALRPLTNPWSMIAAIGLIISANLLLWMGFAPLSTELLAMFIFCLFGLFASVTLFALARKLDQTPVKPKSRPSTKEPTFLRALHTRETREQKS